MNRIRKAIGGGKPDYEQMQDSHARESESLLSEQETDADAGEPGDEKPFSWTEYAVFLLLGIAMLWAW